MLIFHYHIFKNAGTSVDVMLRKNFADRWIEKEFDTSAGNSKLVEDFVKTRPDILALSSHTAQLPLPRVEREIFPIFFVRHPFDRLRSAYEFERMQNADTHGARLAKAHDFTGYVRHLLANPRFRQARNFQTQRLAGFERPANGSERERALRALDSLPFVGVVEAFERSIARLAALLAPRLPGFWPEALHENKTSGRRQSLEERLAALRAELPADLLAELEASNADDFAVYEKAAALLASAA